MKNKYIALLFLMMFVLVGCGPADGFPAPREFAGMRIAILVAPERWSQSEFEGLYNNLAQYSHAQLIVVTINQPFTLPNSETGEDVEVILIDDVDPASLDAIIINGGSGVDLFYEHEMVLSFLVTMDKQGKVIGGVCGGPNVIAASGIVEGRRVAGHYLYQSLLERYGSGYSHDAVLVDGNIVTGQIGHEREIVRSVLRVLAGKQ